MTRGKQLILVALALLVATPVFAAPLKIDMGPTLGDLKTDSAFITWHTNKPSVAWVEIEGHRIGQGGPTQTHRVRVRGLSAGTTYWYTVKASADGESASIGPHRLRTPAESLTEWTFAAYGDTRSRPRQHRQVVGAMLGASPRLILHTGDLVADGDVLEQWYHFFPVIGAFARNLPFYGCLGNHEHNSLLYYTLLPLPKGGGDYQSEWYTFTFGNCQFFVLDSCRRIGEQTEWLRAQLQQPKPEGVDWRFAIFHHPPFSSGPHGANQTLQEQWCPLLEGDNGVAAVFVGHDHLYERSLHGGVSYITLGTGGAPLYKAEASPNAYSQFAVSSLGFCRVDVTPGQLTLTFINEESQPLDQVTITNDVQASLTQQ